MEQNALNNLIKQNAIKRKTSIDVDRDLYDEILKFCITNNVTFTAFYHAALKEALKYFKNQSAIKNVKTDRQQQG